MEFVKRTKKTKNEDSDVGPELHGTEGLREAHSVHACGVTETCMFTRVVEFHDRMSFIKSLRSCFLKVQ